MPSTPSITLSGAVPLRNESAATQQVQPTSISAGWQSLPFVVTGTTAVTVGALGANTMAVATSIPFYRIGGIGTTIRVRVIYDSTATAVSTQLQYRIWGRKSPESSGVAFNEDWQLLQNRALVPASTISPTFGFSASDPTIATGYRATMDTMDASSFDCDGCDEFFIEITQGMSLTGGTNSLARFQVKIL